MVDEFLNVRWEARGGCPNPIICELKFRLNFPFRRKWGLAVLCFPLPFNTSFSIWTNSKLSPTLHFVQHPVHVLFLLSVTQPLWNFVSHVGERKKGGFQTTSGKGGVFFSNTLDRVNKTEWGIINLAEFRWIQSFALYPARIQKRLRHMGIVLFFSLLAKIEIYLWSGFAVFTCLVSSSVSDLFTPIFLQTSGHVIVSFECQSRFGNMCSPVGTWLHTLHSVPVKARWSDPNATSRTSMCWILSIIRFHVWVNQIRAFYFALEKKRTWETNWYKSK